MPATLSSVSSLSPKCGRSPRAGVPTTKKISASTTQPQTNVNNTNTLICPKHVWQEKGGWNTISKCAIKKPNVSNRACSNIIMIGGDGMLLLWQCLQGFAQNNPGYIFRPRLMPVPRVTRVLMAILHRCSLWRYSALWLWFFSSSPGRSVFRYRLRGEISCHFSCLRICDLIGHRSLIPTNYYYYQWSHRSKR